MNKKEHDEQWYHENNYHQCPICGEWHKREEMDFSKDCHGIPYRMVCLGCLSKAYEEKGYDGEYYTDADEQIEDDY